MQKHTLMNPLFAAAISLMIVLSGCDTKGPAEEIGEKIDQTVESAKDAAEEAGDRITGEGPAEEVGEKFDQTVESVKESVDSKN